MKDENCISKTSGQLVEIVHTCQIFGRFQHAGHIDFYVNGGKYQRACIILGCSHLRAITYWVEALENPTAFYAMRCNNYDDFNYDQKRCLQGGNHVYDYMGSESVHGRSPGKFYLTTAFWSPYGRGKSGV